MTATPHPAIALDVHASRLASEHFGDNLVISFIGGSYARGVPRQNSDVDLFVVLHEPDREVETRFALQFLKLHQQHGVDLVHCGEVFSRMTLEHLLMVTERVLEQLPEIQHLACYHGDCILSAFRKGDVVFKFLADPKTRVCGDSHYLEMLEKRAHSFFRRFPMLRVQLEKGQLVIDGPRSVSDLEQTYRSSKATPAYADTPAGVGLERWFGPNILRDYPPTLHGKSISAEFSCENRCRCPLSQWGAQSQRGMLLRNQCLGVLLSKLEGGY